METWNLIFLFPLILLISLPASPPFFFFFCNFARWSASRKKQNKTKNEESKKPQQKTAATTTTTKTMKQMIKQTKKSLAVSLLEESWKQILMKIPTSSFNFSNTGSKTKLKKSAEVAAQLHSWEGEVLDYDLSSQSCLYILH